MEQSVDRQRRAEPAASLLDGGRPVGGAPVTLARLITHRPAGGTDRTGAGRP
ncbi:hypothetical protein [Streptomyces sp. NPDC007991]|uniref:hypothetical protein n=1 Tax=Streptomyces sp. NPDC007991 TaxID=3364803 RepID=UPI0036E7FDBE